MKRLFTLVSGLAFITGASAQISRINVEPKLNQLSTAPAISKAPVATSGEKALGVTFYTNDFSTPSDWTVDNSGQTGAEFGWSIDAVVDGWWAPATGIASVSEGNFAELSNGDPTATPTTQALNVVYTMTTAAPIALTNGTAVTWEFLQYGARFNDLQEMQISTDGVTFTTVGDNLDFDVLSQSGGAAYPNPSTKLINLSSYLGGATQVWLRYRWTTNFPAQASNPNAWVAYGWMIDDVKLSTVADYDLAVTSNYWGSVGLGYYQIPISQVYPIDFSANVANNGGAALTNVQLNVNVTGSGSFAASSAPQTLASGASDSLTLATQFTPAASTGSYTITRTVTQTETEDLPVDNTLSTLMINVTDFIYARDNNVPDGFENNGNTPFEVGNLFDIWVEQEVRGIDVRINTGTPVGREVYAKIYKVAATFELVAESDIYALTAADIANPDFTIDLGSYITLDPNTTYLAMVGSFEALSVSNAGASDPQTSFLLDGNDVDVATMYFTTNTPMVRFNFDPSMGLAEDAVASSVSVAPNPFSNNTAVSFNLKSDASVAVEVVDLAGRVVMTLPAANFSTGSNVITLDGGAFDAGVYTVNLKVDGNVITKRIVKK